MKTIEMIFEGKSQIIQIPKEFNFEGVSELAIEKQGNSLVLTPVKKSWVSFVDSDHADEDFLVERPKIF